MFDPKLYREACRELRAPEDKIEEIIAMTENTNKRRIRPLRTALICAAAVAMMVVGVSAANLEGAEELWYRVMDIVQIGRYRSELVDENGEHMTLMNIPEATVENRDGRAILVIAGDQTIDITDALAGEGRYVYEDTDEGAHLVITVTGTIDNWELTSRLGEPGEDLMGMVGYTNSSELEKQKAEDQDVGRYIISGEDVDSLDGDVVISFGVTERND